MGNDGQPTPVSADKPQTTFNTLGTDHITIWGSNEEATVEYYRDILGMPLVLRQPNLDDPDETHLFFDTGDGTILTFFVNDDRPADGSPQPVEDGSVHHLCFTVEADRFAEVAGSLQQHGYRYNMFDRGIFLSLYTRDHNGLVIELTVDKFEYPEERRGEVLAEAQRVREAEDADYAEEQHLRQALENLHIDYTENDVPNAPSGTGGL